VRSPWVLVTRLLYLFPFDGMKQSLIDQHNEGGCIEMVKTRNFFGLHYHATQRDDTPFWRHRCDMPIPETLTHRIELFKESGHAFQGESELFRVDS
jgi:tryptophan 7-halogenase